MTCLYVVNKTMVVNGTIGTDLGVVTRTSGVVISFLVLVPRFFPDGSWSIFFSVIFQRGGQEPMEHVEAR